jgi:hypothetical protein
MTQTFRQQIQPFSLEDNWRLPGDLIEYSLILVCFYEALILDVLKSGPNVKLCKQQEQNFCANRFSGQNLKADTVRVLLK